MRIAAAVLLIALGGTACLEAPTGVVDASFAGDYSLRTFGPYPLPYRVSQQAALTLEIMSETITLGATGSFQNVSNYRRTTNGVVDFPTITVIGTWTTVGNQITMVASDGDILEGSVNSVSLTMPGVGVTLIFYK